MAEGKVDNRGSASGSEAQPDPLTDPGDGGFAAGYSLALLARLRFERLSV